MIITHPPVNPKIKKRVTLLRLPGGGPSALKVRKDYKSGAVKAAKDVQREMFAHFVFQAMISKVY